MKRHVAPTPRYDAKTVLHAFSRRLRRLRGDQSMLSLSHDTGVTRCSLFRFENRKAWPTLPVAVKLANYFDVTLSDLLALDAETVDWDGELWQLFREVNQEGEGVRTITKALLRAICDTVRRGDAFKARSRRGSMPRGVPGPRVDPRTVAGRAGKRLRGALRARKRGSR